MVSLSMLFVHLALADYLISDRSNHRVQWCPSAPPGSPCVTVAGTGVAGGSAVQLNQPVAVRLDERGDLVICDVYNSRVQLCSAGSFGSACNTVAGVDGYGSGLTQLAVPNGLDLDAAGDYVIAEWNNHCVLLCPASDPGSACNVVADTGGSGSGLQQLRQPGSVTVGATGDYIASDSGNHRVVACSAVSPGSDCTVLVVAAAGTDLS